MRLFYKILYQIGLTPWEEGLAQPSVASEIAAMFDREEAGREPPFDGCWISAVAVASMPWRWRAGDGRPPVSTASPRRSVVHATGRKRRASRQTSSGAM